MDLFEELRAILLLQSEEGEFPTWLTADVMVIAGDPERFMDKSHLIGTPIAQIRDFDPYAGAGCFAIAVSAETIQATIRTIHSQVSLG